MYYIIYPPVHIHDHSWCAESALGARVVHNFLLNLIIPFSTIPQKFNCINFPPVATQDRS